MVWKESDSEEIAFSFFSGVTGEFQNRMINLGLD